MDIELTPDPRPEEREAVLRALALIARPEDGSGRGEWWREGVHENVRSEFPPDEG